MPRCHDHKYDAIPTADYYSLYGIFASSREPSELPLIEPPGAPEAQSPERDAFNKEIAAKRSALDAERERRTEVHRAKSREPKNIANYLLTAHEADGLAPEQLTDRTVKRGLVPLVLSRWRNYLTTAEQKQDAGLRAVDRAVESERRGTGVVSAQRIQKSHWNSAEKARIRRLSPRCSRDRHEASPNSRSVTRSSCRSTIAQNRLPPMLKMKR